MRRIRNDRFDVCELGEQYKTPASSHVVTNIAYDGTVSGGTITLTVYDGETGYPGSSLVLDGNDATYVWDIGRWVVFSFDVADVTGGGDVLVTMKGV